MTQYRALIVDDERLARVALRELLDDRDDIEVVGEADTVADATQQILELQPDVIFLDIEMPDGLGFDLFERMRVEADVIFVTAYDEHALRAFEVNALDYLVKPVNPSDIERSIKRLGSRADSRTASTQLSLDDMVCLHETNSMKFARVRNIVLIRAADDYTEVHLDSGKVALVSQRLRRWEQRLPADCFARVHRSSLVNLHFVEEITSDAGRWTVHLMGQNKSIPMSRRYTQALKRRMELIA